VPDRDHNPDELENAPSRDEPPKEAGEFTRAFGDKAERAKPEDAPSAADSPPPAPGSLTQLLGGKSQKPYVPPTDKAAPPPPADPNRPEPRPASSFTTAFDGVNAFTRNPAAAGQDNISPAAGNKPRSEVTPAESPGSFTRLFGSGEGVLTPAGEQDVEEERPRPPAAHDPKQPRGGLPGSPPAASAPERNAPSRPAEAEPGSFTQAFQNAPEPPASKRERGSFTDQFGSSPSWTGREAQPPSKSALPSTPRPEPAPPAYKDELFPPSTPPRPSAPAGGFTRLIDPLKPEPTSPSDATQPSIRATRLPEYPLPEPNYSSRGPASGHDATIVFNPTRVPEPEEAAPQGKSDYTRVLEGSKFRPQSAVSGIAGAPSAAATSAAPPSAPQYPQYATPAAPAWTPAAAPPAPWQPPQLNPPAMPQAPALAAPALPQKPVTLGDQLVSFLPFMLALTVINFLGLLAVLIILFATRK
jgi:hypothetical protein